VLPVGGINEKIEGYFRICATAGLDGSQGVLIPQRNRHHLMLGTEVVDAVAKGLFHIYTAEHVSHRHRAAHRHARRRGERRGALSAWPACWATPRERCWPTAEPARHLITPRKASVYAK